MDFPRIVRRNPSDEEEKREEAGCEQHQTWHDCEFGRVSFPV
jgi:hypothetical protein